MINLERNACSGCGACAQTCPKNCIEMLPDKEGFLYPHIDAEKCVGCQSCDRVCPVNKASCSSSSIVEAFGAFHLNNEMREKSSSGGIFSSFAEYVIQQGGVVFGAAMKPNLHVEHVGVETLEGLESLRGSKYVQSSIGMSFASAKDYLLAGRLVYFSGTPCQIAGLYAYLGHGYDNLITQDLICHGAPSPYVWESYINDLEKTQNAQIEKVFFRNKKNGWRDYCVYFEFADGTKCVHKYCDDDYMKAFLSNLSLRPSCYECRYKGVERPADITLGDFWGIEQIKPEFDDNRGCSLIIIHSDKGKELISHIKDEIALFETDLNRAVDFNPSAVRSVALPERRKRFMRSIRSCNFERAYKKATTVTLTKRIIYRGRSLLSKVKIGFKS